MSRTPDDETEMRDESDFSDAVQGKYADRFPEGSRIFVLDPDLAAEFPDQDSVNRALRAYLARRKTEEGAA